MLHNWNRIAQISAIGAACSLVVWIGSISAKEESSVLVNKPAANATETQTGPALAAAGKSESAGDHRDFEVRPVGASPRSEAGGPGAAPSSAAAADEIDREASIHAAGRTA